jgi:hypothetical protein
MKLHKNGIVFRHLHDRRIKISSIKIEEKSKSKISQAGFVYIVNDLEK